MVNLITVAFYGLSRTSVLKLGNPVLSKTPSFSTIGAQLISNGVMATMVEADGCIKKVQYYFQENYLF